MDQDSTNPLTVNLNLQPILSRQTQIDKQEDKLQDNANAEYQYQHSSALIVTEGQVPNDKLQSLARDTPQGLEKPLVSQTISRQITILEVTNSTGSVHQSTYQLIADERVQDGKPRTILITPPPPDTSEDPPSANEPKGFLSNCFELLCCDLPATFIGLSCLLITLAIWNCIPIATIVIGALYQDKKDCPVEKHTSLLLIIGGSILLVRNIVRLISNFVVCMNQRRANIGISNPPRQQDLVSNRTRSRSPSNGFDILVFILTLAFLSWLITAAVYVYGVYFKVSYDDNSKNYCNKILYLYAFCLLTVIFAGFGLLLVLFLLSLWCIRLGEMLTEVKVI